MSLALGRSRSDEHRPGLRKVARRLQGQTGLLFTNASELEVLRCFVLLLDIGCSIYRLTFVIMLISVILQHVFVLYIFFVRSVSCTSDRHPIPGIPIVHWQSL